MWPDTPWAPAKGSFSTPVLPPTVDPDASPTKSLAVSCAWLPFIRGALLQLVLQATWKETGDALTLAQMRAMTLISMFDECSTSEVPFACSGDARETASPVGSWAQAASFPQGVFVPLAGWQVTEHNDGSNFIYGVFVEVTFSKPLLIATIRMTYDLSLGTFDNPADYQAGFYDVDNATFLGTPILFGGAIDGTGLHFEAVGAGAVTSHIILFMRSSYAHGADPTVPGLGYVIGLDVSGEVVGGYDCS